MDKINNVQYVAPDELLKEFDSADVNGNGKLSCAELDKFVVQQLPKYNRKPAIQRAYEAADRDDDGYVLRTEFPMFYMFLVLYNTYWDVFSAADEDQDRRLTKEEFTRLAAQLEQENNNNTDRDAQKINVDQIFAEIDINKGGYILFDEFCAFCTKRKMALTHLKASMNRNETNPNTGGLHTNARMTTIIEIPDHVKEDIPLPADDELNRIFDSIDMNGNAKLSLAELDKYIQEERPEWNHKSAIMRAYRAADRNSSGYIHRTEFPFFYRFIILYNQFWDLFVAADVDKDRRISKDEFKSCAEQLLGGNAVNVDLAFAEIDLNGGGVVLFDEFCAYCAKQKIITSSSKV